VAGPLPSTLSALRELLQERFPQAARPPGRHLTTGIAGVDEHGGLPRAALTELVCSAPSCGSQLFFGQVLQQARERGGRVGLIDAANQFDPAGWPETSLEPLVWVRCLNSESALPAAELFARDANLELVVLDLRRAAPHQVRRIPAAAWYRLQRAVEQSDLAFLAITPVAVVPSAQLRLALPRSHHLADQSAERSGLAQTLTVTLQRQRLAAAG
jgi:hypothetical protein